MAESISTGVSSVDMSYNYSDDKWKETFDTSPYTDAQKKQFIALSMYHEGDGRVRCAKCGGGMKDVTGSPILEHSRHYPNCQRDLTKKYTCLVCLDAIKNRVQLPCGHITCCETCIVKVTHCVTCRALIRGTVNCRNDPMSERCFSCNGAVETLFLPCRCIVSCEQCQTTIDTCPCGQEILGTARVYIQ